MRIAAATLRGHCAALFRAAGSEAAEADCVAEHLVEANLRGHDSHGAIRAPKYVEWVAAGELLPNRHASIVLDAGGLLLLDGGFGYGQVIGREAMALAAERARAHGACVLGIRDSGHLGRIGAWPEMLAEAGLVSVHFVNTSGYGILVAPHGGVERRLSANPIAAGAPGPDGPIVLDIATSATAEGKIQVARNRGEALAEGLVLDGAGAPTTSAEEFYGPPPGAILPFGGHKGYGLSVFCELLAGSLTGGGASNPGNPSAWRLVNNMLSIAIDPARLAGAQAFGLDVARLREWITSARRAEGGDILLPGELEARCRAERMRAGIPLDDATIAQMNAAAQKLGVAELADG